MWRQWVVVAGADLRHCLDDTAARLMAVDGYAHPAVSRIGPDVLYLRALHTSPAYRGASACAFTTRMDIRLKRRPRYEGASDLSAIARPEPAIVSNTQSCGYWPLSSPVRKCRFWNARSLGSYGNQSLRICWWCRRHCLSTGYSYGYKAKVMPSLSAPYGPHLVFRVEQALAHCHQQVVDSLESSSKRHGHALCCVLSIPNQRPNIGKPTLVSALRTAREE